MLDIATLFRFRAVGRQQNRLILDWLKGQVVKICDAGTVDVPHHFHKTTSYTLKVVYIAAARA
jgi:hypothetical protein